MHTGNALGLWRLADHWLSRCALRRLAVLVTLLCLTIGGSAATARAEPRIALVIGNGAYGSVTALDNPESDARLMAATLTRMGFEVILVVDGTQIDMKRAIAQFGRDLRGAGPTATGLFYYAGHGVQSYGNNYLLPVDVALSDQADLDLVGVDAQTILRQMFSAANQTNIFILDACRNNPFTDIPEFNDPGLAEMQAPRGTFLAYATAPGEVAYDGEAGNSPFTSSVVDQMNRPGLSIERMFRQVRVSVLDKTGGLQTPWDSSSLTREFVFNRIAPDVGQGQSAAKTDWDAAQASGDVLDLILFLRRHPESVYADEAQDLLTERMRDRAPSSPTAVAAAPAAPDTSTAPSQSTGSSPSADDAPDSPGPGLTAEEQMFAAARADGTAIALEAYLTRYPDGVFADVARAEMARLDSPAPTRPMVLAFRDPLASEVPQLAGRSISQIIRGSPIYPPIPGLPEAVWQNKPCANCHQWTEASLCEQASRYLVAQAGRSLEKPHPFGGAFKSALKDWATGGCR